MELIGDVFQKHENNFSSLAQQFRVVMQKLRNMSSSEVKILKDIYQMRKQLESHLTDVTDFNMHIQQTSEKVVGELSKLERRIPILKEEKAKYEMEKNNSNEALNEAEKRLKEHSDEQIEFSDKLLALQNEQNILTKKQRRLSWIPISGWIAIGLVEIYKKYENYEGQIAHLNEAIASRNSKIADFRQEICNYQTNILEKAYDIYECQEELNDRSKAYEKLKENQYKSNEWLKLLNEWLQFLIDIEPQVKRVERHIGNNEIALKRAIGDMKNAIYDNELKQLEAKTKHLAIASS